MFRKLVITTFAVVCLLCPSAQANQKSSVSSVKKTTKISIVKPVRLGVKDHIVKQSIELGIDPALALSIAKTESGFRHDKRSSFGAVGVFQLMPSTAHRMGLNPYFISDNIKGGLMYYKRMYDMFGSTELALAAYNAGPAAVKKYKSVPPYGETRRFVSGIMAEYHRQKNHPDFAIQRAKSAKYSYKKTVTSKHNQAKTVTSKHANKNQLSGSYGFEHRLVKENSLLMNKTLAKQQNVRFELVKKI